jgi:rhamnose utilization protein RhaD (predicted bifunctional aldolase and dehydrogenase)/NAD(P)-dependent dehydrogenase (short-subunit alcohol dehydrogenase family)
MRSKWSDEEAAGFVARFGAEWGEALALRAYSARLLGAEPALVLHGGGNSSVKAWWTNILGEDVAAVFVKASGADMATIEPSGFPGLDLEYLRRLRLLPDLSDAEMVDQFQTHLLRSGGLTPSIEALVHAFLPDVYIDHTHADAILALTNRDRGETAVREALGDEVIVLPYVTPGFKLAQAAITAREAQPSAWGMVWGHHGLVTWGSTARESYEVMISLVTRAEQYVAAGRITRSPKTHVVATAPAGEPSVAAQAKQRAMLEPRLAQVAPVLRGLLAGETGDCDRPHRRVILLSLSGPEVLAALEAPWARQVLVTAPLTTDHLIRTKSLPLWVDELDYENDEALRSRLYDAVARYCADYGDYLARHVGSIPAGIEPFDPHPRVVMIPGLGVFSAGPDLREATITRDITEHTIATKASIGASGVWYRGLDEDELFTMEYRTLQHAKLGWRGTPASLQGHVTLVTGAAGAIGTGICRGLLAAGSLVAATDLPGEPLQTLVSELGATYPGRIIAVPLDVTDATSVAAAFAEVARTWGGVDLVIPNAGVALTGPLTGLTLERYRKLEQVNVEGTLLVLAEAGRFFKRQGTGGDIVLVSTKNVFSPGAGFGAYSSTKAAAHQLARIASLELAGDDVRVNMVSPDAVFACGTCRSGLWAEVGPERMKARGLDETGLEAYYRDRNLLKAQVTADHVANAVLFFATRQTPTTGATIPVDGGLPDSTPR